MLRLLSVIALEVDIAGAWHERQGIVEMIGFDFRHLLIANVNSHQCGETGVVRHSYQMVSIRRHERRGVHALHDQLRLGARRAQPESHLIFPPAGADEITSRPNLPKTIFIISPASFSLTSARTSSPCLQT